MSTFKLMAPISYSAVPSEMSRIINGLRADGYADYEIAERMDLQLSEVESFPPPRPRPERSRAVQHQQLMQMAQSLMPKVAEGNVQAIQTMLKVMQREASLLGLDAPKEIVSKNFVKDMRDPTDMKSYSMDELMAIVVEDLGLPPGTVLTPDQIKLLVEADKAKQIIQGECSRDE